MFIVLGWWFGWFMVVWLTDFGLGFAVCWWVDVCGVLLVLVWWGDVS